MKLTLKTVTGVNFSLDAEPTDTVRERPGERDPRVTSHPPDRRGRGAPVAGSGAGTHVAVTRG